MHANLSDRQLRFVFEYLLDQNACAAAVRAGYSRHSRKSAAHSLMGNPAVLEAIRVELGGLVAEAGCSVVALVKERARGAFFRAGKMFGAGWEVLAPDEMEADTRAALQVSVAWRRGEPTVRLRQPNRDKALRALERLHERLEEASERYYASLEEEDLLAEVEALEREAALAEVGGAEGVVGERVGVAGEVAREAAGVAAGEVVGGAMGVAAGVAVAEAAGEVAREVGREVTREVTREAAAGVGLAGVGFSAGGGSADRGLGLSGPAAGGVADGVRIVEKGMVLSGSAQQAASIAVVAGSADGTDAQAGGGWRGVGAKALRALFPEKGQVLSGSPAAAGGAGFVENSRVLSGSAGTVPLEVPPGGLGAATSLLTGRPGWGGGGLRVG